MKVVRYLLISGVMFRRNFDGMLLRCLGPLKYLEVLKEMYEGVCGGHFPYLLTTHKAIMVKFYCPAFFANSYKIVRSFFSCQFFLGRMKRSTIPLTQIVLPIWILKIRNNPLLTENTTPRTFVSPKEKLEPIMFSPPYGIPKLGKPKDGVHKWNSRRDINPLL